MKNILNKPELFLTVAALFLYLINLGNVALRDWDEGYYATVGRDIYWSNNWLYPSYLGEPFLLKPPLLFWLINISYHFGGVNDLTSRLPASLLSGLAVPLIYCLAREILPQKRMALWSAIVYLTLLPLVRHDRLAMLDGITNTFLIFSLFTLVKGKQKKPWLFGVGLGLGMIALTKGALVLLFILILLVFLIWDRQLKILLNPYFIAGIIIGFAPACIWYILQYLHYGQTFIDVHFASQVVDRVTKNFEGHQQPIWYYFLELVKYSVPWLLFLPGSILYAKDSLDKSWAKLGLIGFVLYLSMVSLMQSKLPWYIIPLYPFISLLVGAYLETFARNSPKKATKVISLLLYLLSFLTIVGLIYLLIKGLQIYLIILAIVLSIAFGFAAKKLKDNPVQSIVLLAGGMYLGLTLLMFSSSWLWELKEAFPVKPVAQLILNNTPAKEIIYSSFAYNRPSLDYYSQHKVEVQEISVLKKIVESDTISYLLVTPSVLKELNLYKGSELGIAEGFILWKTK